MSEAVMVVPTPVLVPFFGGRTHDVIRENSGAILDLIVSQHTFIPREVAEVSPEYRQIIPYVVITCGDEVFVTRRTKKQTESRLHDKVSLGIGGHINPGDDLLAGLRKELDEEVRIGGAYELAFAGILNDESTEVSRVHLGAVHLLTASTREVEVLETEKMTGGWVARAELPALREAMESWSQIVYDALLA
jgi:predicted NUDIX family phosphoesterase